MDNGTYYRNKKALVSNQGMLVDDNSLWLKGTDNILVLEDDDEFHTYVYDEALFVEA